MLKSIFSKIKSKKVVITAVLVVGLASAVFVQYRHNAAADNCTGISVPSTPAFNIWPISFTPQNCMDLPMVDVRAVTGSGRSNYATNQSDHDAGITVAGGDQVRVRVYFHNGASPANQATATAHGVFASTNIDLSSGTSHRVGATLGANNATSVSSFAKGGDTKINSSQPTTLQYVPGSANMCIGLAFAQQLASNGDTSVDLNTSCGVAGDGSPMVVRHLSDGIVNGNISLPDLPACFPYSGFITFTLNAVAQTPTPGTGTVLSIDKSVRDITKNQSAFQSSIQAAQGDVVEFQVIVRNTGSVTATGVVASDALPAGIASMPGTVTLNGNSASDSFIGSGISIPDLAPSAQAVITFRATFNLYSGSITNTAFASASNANQVSASASITAQAQQVGAISISKTVRDVARGQSFFGKSVSAQQGDTVDFQIVVTDTGNGSVTGISLSDQLPTGLSFISGSVTLNGGSASDSLVTSGMALPDLSAGSSATIVFSAQVNVNSGTLNNTAQVTSSAGTQSDSASVIVSGQGQSSLTISKSFRDVTQGQSAYVTNYNVTNGDTLQFQLVITNTGSTTLSNAVVTDILPSGLIFQPSSIILSTPGISTSLSNILVSSLAPGQSFTVTFNATVSASCGIMNNTATVSASAVSPVTSNQVTINVSCGQQSNLSISKVVRDVTQGTQFAKSVNANQGDRVGYQITITALNGPVNNVAVYENMPSYLNYVSGSGRLNGNYFTDSFVLGSTNIGSLSQGQTATIYFEATVASTYSYGQYSIINTASASGDNAPSVSDSATVNVNYSSYPSYNYGNPQLSITKLVKNDTYAPANYFQKSVSAHTNDRVTFQITVTNLGGYTANNVYVNDLLPAGLSYIPGTARLDNYANADQVINSRFSIGAVGPGQSRTIVFDATVTAGGVQTLTNTAQGAADNFPSFQDTASVFVTSGAVLGANVNMNYSKSAFNSTQNINATSAPANPEDYITYTLTAANTGNSTASGFVISDDLSNVLPYADMVDMGGGYMNGSVILWPAQDIPAGASVSKYFKVRVKYQLPAGNISMINSYGNTVTIKLNNGHVLGASLVAPKTGASEDAAAVTFAASMTAAYAVWRRRGYSATVKRWFMRLTGK